MKSWLLILFFALVLVSCNKEEETIEVTFTIRENSASAPTYNITYTSDQTGTSSIASNNDNHWTSDKRILTKGQFVSLQTECTEPEFALVLYIYVNGNLWKSANMNNPTASAVISGNLPSD